MRPGLRVHRYAPGESAVAPLPGDLVFVRGRGPLAALIYTFQRIRFSRPEDRPYAHWSHAALVTSPAGHLVEAGPRGLVVQSLEKYRGHEYHHVRFQASLRRRGQAARLAQRDVGQRYATLSFLALGLSTLLGDRLRVPDRGQQTCVAVVARAVEQMLGVAAPRRPSEMMPADLARWLEIRP